MIFSGSGATPETQNQPRLNVLSLCSGIGALELGLERAGMHTVGQVEIDPYCQQVLAKHWPEVPRHDDVRTVVEWWRGLDRRPRVHAICAGYPCQPFSTAGRMLGAEDHRHLWPHVLHAIRDLRPRYVIVENVPAHIGLGLDGVLADLAGVGFDAQWSVVPASALGAPQRRPRLFLVAYPEGGERLDRRWVSAVAASRQGDATLADAHRCRAHGGGAAAAVAWPAEPRVGRMVDGPPYRVDRRRLHALGNAVVPQVAEYVGSLIVAHSVAALDLSVVGDG